MDKNLKDFSNSLENHEIKKKFYYKIDNSTLGPFDYEDDKVRVFLNTVTDFSINYTMEIYYPSFYEKNLECYTYVIIIFIFFKENKSNF